MTTVTTVKIMTNMKAMITTKAYLRAGVLCFGFLMFLGCQSDSKLSAEAIIEKTIQAHGGIEKWQDVKQLSFDKSVTLFNEDGSTEISTDQFQLFRFGEKLFVKLEWEQEGNDMQIIYENDKVTKMVNDSIVTNEAELARAENAVFAAHYVVCQPFDLLKSGATLTLDETITHNGKECYVIKVNYPGDDEDADQWYYIIDPDSFEVVANQVVLTDHTSWVENLTYDDQTDFQFNSHRKSYRLNEVGEKTYLRAEYFYENYSVEY